MILVTGGCGYIGSHIVKNLSESGESVVAFDNLVAGTPKALLHGEALVVGDITDPSALNQVFADHKVNVVIHCAALVNAAESVAKSKEYKQVNDLGSRNVWEAAKDAGVKHFIYASSAAVYGTPQSEDPIKESAPLVPTNPYGETKLAGESSLQEIIGKESKYIIFRFFNVAGAEEGGRLRQNPTSRAIMERLFAVANGEDAKLVLSGNDYETEDGTVVRDFVHVEDIARAVLLGVSYLQSNKPSLVANLGTGQITSMKELHQLAEQITGKPIPLEYAPRNPGDISYSLADVGLAKSTLGWSPTKSVRDMIRDGWNAYVKA